MHVQRIYVSEPTYEAPFDVDGAMIQNWPYIAPVLTGTKQCCINPQAQRNLTEKRRAMAKAKGKAKGKAKAASKAASKEKAATKPKEEKAKTKPKAKAKAKTEAGPRRKRADTAYNVERKKFFAKFLSCTSPAYSRHCMFR